MDLYSLLNELKIEYEEHIHEPVFTIEQANDIKDQLEGTGCKNIFIADKKGENFALMIIHPEKRADLKAAAALLDLKKPRFAKDDELMQLLHLTPGSVSPFGLINDAEHRVVVLLDSELKSLRLLFHPNDNSKTIALSCDDLMRFLSYCGNRCISL
ncbi:MAG: prolyl-tRNA synthetase associated domain-containing protein [Clostridia bacterium]|nr:prolyl-tRNA synthetase associated domain-containing protein [Clostridia bacterium]